LTAELIHTKHLLKLLLDDYQLLCSKVSKITLQFDQIRETTATLRHCVKVTEDEVKTLTENLAPVANLHLSKRWQSQKEK
jgi:hypothetical protein